MPFSLDPIELERAFLQIKPLWGTLNQTEGVLKRGFI
jgi:hypothetical protein